MVTAIDTTPLNHVPSILPSPGAAGLLPGDAEMRRMVEIAKIVATANPKPKTIGNWQSAFGKILAGRELGMPPMTALAEIDLIDGKYALSAIGKVAIVRRRGLGEIRLTESTSEKAVASVNRPEWGPDQWKSVEFTMDQARQIRTSKGSLATKDNWRNWPQSMLAHRAQSIACKLFFAELFVGVKYDADELGVETDEEGRPIDYAAGLNIPSAVSEFDQPNGDSEEPVPTTEFDEKPGPGPKPIDTNRVASTIEARRAEAMEAYRVAVEARASMDSPSSTSRESAPVDAPPQLPQVANEAPDADYHLSRISLIVQELGWDRDEWKSVLHHFGPHDSIRQFGTDDKEKILQHIQMIRKFPDLCTQAGLGTNVINEALAKRGLMSVVQLSNKDVILMTEKLQELATPF